MSLYAILAILAAGIAIEAVMIGKTMSGRYMVAKIRNWMGYLKTAI
jgi:hypothetical protein